MRRTISAAPTIPIEIAKSRATVDESPCVPEEELEEDEGAIPEEEPEDEGVVLEEEPEDEAAVPVLLLVCDAEESRTSKLSHIQSVIFSVSRKITGNLHEHINDSILATRWDGYSNRMLLICSTGPRCKYL